MAWSKFKVLGRRVSFFLFRNKHRKPRGFKTTHIYYGTVSIDQETQHGSNEFFAQGASLKALANCGPIFLWERIWYKARLGYWQNLVLRKCKTEVPFSLLIARLRLLSAPRGCSQFLDNSLCTHLIQDGSNRILQGQQRNLPCVKSPSCLESLLSERIPFF